MQDAPHDSIQLMSIHQHRSDLETQINKSAIVYGLSRCSRYLTFQLEANDPQRSLHNQNIAYLFWYATFIL